MNNFNKLFQFISILSLLWGASAFAVDGVLEINHACSTNAGCFTGDTAGYPVTVDGSAGRSYRLTSDLVIPNENTDGIFITAARVTIDLNGFEIIGAACVQTATVDCRPDSGSGSGVTVHPSNGANGVSVANGSITGMGRDGVFLGFQAEVKNLRVLWNGFRGISVEAESIVSNNSVLQNGQQGILSEEGRSIISGNISSFNVGDGIRTGIISNVSDNIVTANEVNGIFAGAGSRVSGNTAALNGQNGITADGVGLIQNNIVHSNQALGLNLTPTTAYLGNTITDNVTGGVNDGKNQGHNFCSGDNVIADTCP